jgi:hypothetical protein
LIVVLLDFFLPSSLFYPRYVQTENISGIEKDDQETDPARHDSDGRVRADEHQGQELKAGAEDERVAERAVSDQRDGDGGVEEGEAVEEEVARVGGTVLEIVSLRVVTSGNSPVGWLRGAEVRGDY